MRKLLLASLTVLHLVANGETIDWSLITHWAGEGNNRAALVVQFASGSNVDNPGAVVWGYRWTDDATPTGYDMISEIATASDDLAIFTQYTGYMGRTLCGIGFAKEVEAVLGALEYDFDSASEDPNISFDFFDPNMSMGQTSAPGGTAIDLAFEAIEEAMETHILDHPLNYDAYGYPAYDYDWWQPSALDSGEYWNAGWYNGYWSYWVGGTDMSDLAYSGLGMSSVYLADGDVNGWKYLAINEDDMNDDFSNYLDANSQWLPLNYAHFTGTGLQTAESADSADAPCEYYRLDGIRVARPSVPGFYIVKSGKNSHIIKF